MASELQTPNPIQPSGPNAVALSHPKPSEPNGWRTFGIVVITMFFTTIFGYWLVTVYLFPTSFSPVKLNEGEQRQLDQKLRWIGFSAVSSNVKSGSANGPKQKLEPERYSEVGAKREVSFSEREVNAILAHNTDLADKLAIDLSDNLASAKLLVPLDPDFPFLGGKTLKVTAGLEIFIGRTNPRVVIKGVSLWGVPIPNAWLGNMKNVNLLDEFGQSGGFWQSFQDGVESVEIRQEALAVKLKE